MDGAGSIVSDGSGHAHDGTMAGGVSWADDGVWGRALSFDGTGYVSVPHAEDLQGFTAATWVLWLLALDVPPTTRMPLEKSSCYRFNTYDNRQFGFQFATTEHPWASGLMSGVWTALGVWHLFLATYDGSRMVIYVDGVFANAKNTSGPVGSRTNSLVVGAEGASLRPFVGRIDEVAIYNRAWSEAEVARYHRILAP